MMRRTTFRLAAAAAGSTASSGSSSTAATTSYSKMDKVEAKIAAKKLSKKWASAAYEGARHLYHGFRLFGANTRLAWSISRKLQEGIAITRRERMLLERATVDLMRLVPFSLFIIVPGGELFLPVALKMFPGIIPSTFETTEQGRNQAFGAAMKTMRARKMMIEYMSATSLSSVGSSSRYNDVLKRLSTGDRITEEHIRSVANMCRKDSPLGLYNIPTDILLALAQSCGVAKPYHSVIPKRYLEQQLRRTILDHFYKLKQDDQVMKKEGLAELTYDELQKACQARGMRWVDDEDTLLQQLEWWVNLSSDPKIPYNTLFWIKPTCRSLRKSMEGLPIDQRRQLLGIMHLSPTVREQMEDLCEKIEKHQDKELDVEYETDELAAKADDVPADLEAVEKRSRGTVEVEHAIAEYLSSDEKLIHLYDEILEKEGRVTISNMIDYLAADIHHSAHMVSTVFDELELGEGKKVMTITKLRSVRAHCKEVAKGFKK